MIKETIEIKLKLLTDKFNSQMDKSKNQMSILNKKLLKQKEQFGAVRSKINATSSSIRDFNTLNKKQNKEQKEFVSGQKRALAGYRVEETAIGNNVSAIRQQQSVLRDSMQNRERLFKKKQRGMKDSIKNSVQETAATKLSNMQNMNWNGIMRLNLQDYQTLAKSQKTVHKTSGKAAMGIRNLTHGLRGFQMAALGVMFFGMSLQRMFTGLLKPIMSTFGIFEIFSLMLTVLFLPIMEALFPLFLKLVTWFMNLSPSVKMAIGIFVLLGIALGTMLMLIGTVVLGIGSLILMFGIIAEFGPAVIAALAGAFWPVVAVIAIIIAIVVAMRIAWKENFLGMKAIVENIISGMKDFFSGLIMFFKGIFLIIKGIFMGDWSLIWEGVKKIFVGAGHALWGLIKIIVNGIGAIFVGLIRIVWGVIKLIIAPFIWLWNFLVGHSLIPDMINAIIDWFKKLPGAIWSIVKDIGGLIAKGFVNLLPDWIVDILKKGISFVSDIFGGGKTSKRENDFIWRPGQGSVSINPNDTLVGYKGAAPDLGGGSSSNSTTNNFYGFTMDDLKRELDDRDRKVVSQMERNR